MGKSIRSKFVSKSLIRKCHSKLIRLKAELLNSIDRSSALSQTNLGDFGDQIRCSNEGQEWIIFQTRSRRLLLEIEAALSRIEQGTFGVCEKTGNPIEFKRLLSLPWTRWSLEGAHEREQGLNL